MLLSHGRLLQLIMSYTGARHAASSQGSAKDLMLQLQ